jgi:mRNA interferase MazF
MKKFFRKFRRNLKKIRKLIPKDEFTELLKHFISLLKQNIKIKLNYNNFIQNGIKSPITKCQKGDIFWVDFGYGVGTEFRYWHFCAVLSVDKNNVIVVPFTSNPNRINQSSMVVNLGILTDIQDPNDPLPKTSYALIHSIRSISRARLFRPRINNKIVRTSLTSTQMNSIINNLINHL